MVLAQNGLLLLPAPLGEGRGTVNTTPCRSASDAPQSPASTPDQRFVDLARAAARAVARGEAPAPFCSRRDGRALRRVPPSQRLGEAELAAALLVVMSRRAGVAAEASLRLANQRHTGRTGAGGSKALAPELPAVPERGLLAWLRGRAYLEASREAGHEAAAKQALMDARTAVAYAPGPRPTSSPASCTAASAPPPADGAATGPITAGGWAAAHVLLAEALAAAGEPGEEAVLALLAAWAALPAEEMDQEAAETKAAGVRGGASGPEAPQLWAVLRVEVEAALEAAVERLPGDATEAVEGGGAEGLRALLARRAEAALPEVLRPRPRWSHYEAWMRSRIEAAAPGLPEPVVARLLAATDATDLDLLLQHPLGLLAQAEEYTQVLQLAGPEALAAHTPEPLDWEEMQALAGGGLVGLPLGYDAAQHAQQAQQGPHGPPQAQNAPRLPLAGPGSEVVARECVRLALEQGLAGEPCAGAGAAASGLVLRAGVSGDAPTAMGVRGAVSGGAEGAEGGRVPLRRRALVMAAARVAASPELWPAGWRALRSGREGAGEGGTVLALPGAEGEWAAGGVEGAQPGVLTGPSVVLAEAVSESEATAEVEANEGGVQAPFDLYSLD
ncbi:hypothetical protein HYH03_000250 [Edaphochlamys debaryana]|uniref:Uncharacterized protein n=1 Tax=Edaphochlamys debaryana TaxID=47281 RepID=A0A835YF95_9CHLO|nr:hypothetical protein HYH03_000250 [Edaphochlamys debaryana]|eukprot:KAG2501750.1 hypothetical protein HYH03_000250 [Edaphochlamys debaryana]